MVSLLRTTFFLIFFLFGCSINLYGADPKVDAQIDTDNPPQQGFAIQGILSITHDTSQKVDNSSFKLDKEPLKIDFVRDVKISPSEPLVISLYNFSMPAMPAGIQMLPAISVKIGDKVFKSISSTFEVRGGTAAPTQVPTQQVAPQTPASAAPSPSTSVTPLAPSTSQSTAPVPVKLKLESFVDGTQPMYPGQYVKLVYRFAFEGLIDLSKEQLPMIDTIPSGLNKIGDPEIKDGNQGPESIREFSQVVQGGTPGKYQFAGSFIEGFAYQLSSSGEKIYEKTPLRSETPAIVLEVVPFPLENQPGSFKGAIGQSFDFKTTMSTSAEVAVGEKINLNLEVTGTTGLKDVVLSDLCCQPGFSGLFKIGDLPSAGQIKETTKTFTVEIRPLTANIKQIPSVEFSYFNPKDKKYVVIHSKSIDLKVKASQAPADPMAQLDKKLTTETKDPGLPTIPKKVEPLKIHNNYEIKPEELYNWFFKTWWVLMAIPIGTLLLLLQIKLRNFYRLHQGDEIITTSSDLFKEFTYSKDQAKSYHFLQQAFMTRLVERHDISSTDIAVQEIPNHGFAGEVRSFLSDLEAQLYAGKEGLAFSEIIKQAKALFKKGISK